MPRGFAPVEDRMTIYNVISFCGLFILLGLAWMCSENRKVVNWRIIFWGLSIQLFFAIFIFILPIGRTVFLFINKIFVAILDSAMQGSLFLFGRIAIRPGTVSASGEESLGYSLFFQGLMTIVFFAAVVGALYYMKVFPIMIRGFARFFTRTMKISGAESLCASSNIFVGVESALVIKPHLKEMTRSELTTILAASMGTIASTVLAVYVSFLQGTLPMIAGHLISASFLSAPAAVMMAKLIVPETESPKTMGLNIKPYYEREDNLIMSVINGANSGLRYLSGIAALLLAFLGILALLDSILGWFGGNINSLLGFSFEWSFRNILGYISYPFTVILGVPPADALEVSKLIGERFVATEVTSYQNLARLLSEGALSHPRSAVIASYALCGFAHIASLAIFVGGIGALVPDRLKDLSRLGFKALLAATLACLMTGAIAGTFVTSSSILLGG